MREQITIVKIGGNVVDNPEALSVFVRDFASLPGNKILVHGGGKEATRMSAGMGIETKMIDGRRVTDAHTLELVTMVYAGLINKRIVAMLQAAGCNALGMTGADACSVTATKRSGTPIDYGFVGDISAQGVNGDVIDALIRAGIVPVFCAIMHDGNGQLLNCNADSVAAALARGLALVKDVDLVYCFEKKGVLRDIDDDNSVIGKITPDTYPALKDDKIISKGMIPKIDNALEAVAAGVRTVRICHAADVNKPGAGTVISKG